MTCLGCLMRTHTLATALTLPLLLYSSGAAADGNALLKACTASIAAFDSDGVLGSDYQSGYCLGIINGVSSLSVLLNGAISKGKQYCLPEPMTNIQAARIVVKYLNDNPNVLHHPEGYAVIGAFQSAFPCE